MKKIILAFFLVLALVSVAGAKPFLVCDCTPADNKITGFKMQFGSDPWIDVPAVSTCSTNPVLNCGADQKMICYDLQSLPVGPFTVKARAYNLWGESADSPPFSDTKALPVPITIRIAP